MKLNSNTLVLKKGSEEYNTLEKIVSKIASENKIENVHEIKIKLDKESGNVKFAFGLAQEEEDFEEFEPEEGDIFLFPTGVLGGMTGVSADGKFIDKFNEEEEARMFVKQWMEKNQYWPNVWYQDDHGGYTLIKDL